MVAVSPASASLLVSASLLSYLIFSALEMLLIVLYKLTFTYLLLCGVQYCASSVMGKSQSHRVWYWCCFRHCRCCISHLCRPGVRVSSRSSVLPLCTWQIIQSATYWHIQGMSSYWCILYYARCIVVLAHNIWLTRLYWGGLCRAVQF